MTEMAAGFLGLGIGDLDDVVLGRDRFLRNVQADIANAFAHIVPSSEARRLAEQLWLEANEVAETASLFSTDNRAHVASKAQLMDTLEKLVAEVTACPSSDLARALGY